MGCDVHMHIEIKIQGTWEHWGNPQVPRNYEVFARLAGVRGDAEPIDRPRGLPGDATTATQWDSYRWGDDAHSHSWISSAEAADLMSWSDAEKLDYHRRWDWVAGTDFRGFIDFPDDRPKGLDDFRLVFWFDN